MCGAAEDEGGVTELLDPCQWWFYQGDKVVYSRFYTAQSDQVAANGRWFPMSWDVENGDVAGEYRLDFMRELCSNC